MINPFLTNIFKIELSEEDKQKRHTSPYLFQTSEEMERIRSNTIVEFVVNGERYELNFSENSASDEMIESMEDAMIRRVGEEYVRTMDNRVIVGNFSRSEVPYNNRIYPSDLWDRLTNPQVGISTVGYGSLVDNEININMLTMYGSPTAQDIPFKWLVDRNILLQIKCDFNPFINSYIGQSK